MGIRLEYSNICTDEKVIHDIMSIEESVYTPAHIGSFDSISKRFNKFKEMFVLAYNDANKLIGYLCYFPISDDLYNRILNDDKLYDDDITPDDILDWGESDKFYLLSVAIYEEYQKQYVAAMLMRKFLRKLHAKESNTQVIDILSSAITQDGEHLLEEFGFTLNKDLKDAEGYKLFILKYIR